MKTFRFPLFGPGHCVSVLLAGSAWLGFNAPVHAAASSKVRVMVTENMATTASPKATPEPKDAPAAGEPKPAPKAGGKPSVAGFSYMSDAIYTHTVTKSFNIRVSNLTKAPLDVTVKTTILAKDEAGKHETVTEKAFENKLTVVPGKSEEFKTDDVIFTHTSAHRATQAAGKGTAGKGPAAKGRAPQSQMEPASGHAYLGYKVEVFEGADLVGSTQSAAH